MSYLFGILKGIGGRLLAGSSTSNHVHLLAHTPTDNSIAEFIRKIKSSSSKWYRETDNKHSTFGWNEGYSAFTVSPSSIDNVKQYMANEKDRHANSSFEDELLGFLRYQEIEFNPEFLTNTTHSRLIFHLVWSVKDREPALSSSIQIPLHQYIQHEIQNSGCKLLAIGNVSDHIHLLIESTTKITLSELVQNLKTKTSHLIKSHDKKLHTFSWQEGYGVFSVGKPALQTVKNYVNNQEHHHSNTTFDQEWNWLKGMK